MTGERTEKGELAMGSWLCMPCEGLCGTPPPPPPWLLMLPKPPPASGIQSGFFSWVPTGSSENSTGLSVGVSTGSLGFSVCGVRRARRRHLWVWWTPCRRAPRKTARAHRSCLRAPAPGSNTHVAGAEVVSEAVHEGLWAVSNLAGSPPCSSTWQYHTRRGSRGGE